MTKTDVSYHAILEGLKQKIRLARQKVARAINNEILAVYWEIGHAILIQQEKEGWGTKVIERLVYDLKEEFQDMKGLSLRNLKYMRAFAEAYPQFVQQPAAQIQDIGNQFDIIVQQAAAQLPWTHHQVILDKTKAGEERTFYIRKAAENGWSRNVLLLQIQNQLHIRQGQAITNFNRTLPSTQSDLAKETLKNPYVFDFLSIGDEIKERDLEKALMRHMKRFMLELGRGFTYVGNQYNIVVEGDEYFLDLLFFNYHLNCFIVFELKVAEFKPEYAGKLNFYINTIDAQIKASQHASTIGVLLCKTPNETVVKYALKGIQSPMGVAEYELTNTLPKQLKGGMPSIEELELELEKEIKEIRKPIDEKKNRFKEILARMKGEEIRKAKNGEDVIYLFEKVLFPVRQRVEEMLKIEMDLFSKKYFNILINDNINTFYTLTDLEAQLVAKVNIWQLGLGINLEGFKPAGTKAFSVSKDLIITLAEYKYFLQLRDNPTMTEYLYHYQWTDDDILRIAEQWSELIMDEINYRLENIVLSPTDKSLQ